MLGYKTEKMGYRNMGYRNIGYRSPVTHACSVQMQAYSWGHSVS